MACLRGKLKGEEAPGATNDFLIGRIYRGYVHITKIVTDRPHLRFLGHVEVHFALIEICLHIVLLVSIAGRHEEHFEAGGLGQE